jgi:hypothetical protein
MTENNLKQIEINYRAFEKELPNLLPAQKGKFALMRDGKILEFFDTARDAYITGQRMFEKDKLFSVQEITDVPINLGFFSYAIPER